MRRTARAEDLAVCGARRGFSLVEVIAAAVILSLGTLAAVGLAWLAAREAVEVDRRERLLWAVEGVRDSLAHASAGASSGERSLPFGATMRWSHGPSGGEVEGWIADSVWVRLPIPGRDLPPLPGSS